MAPSTAGRTRGRPSGRSATGAPRPVHTKRRGREGFGCCCLLLLFSSCEAPPPLSSAETPAPAHSPTPTPAPSSAPPVRPQLDGRGFPDKVLALTWDDGPDTNTLALASYLAEKHVSATFFVVREWSSGLSSDPGSGTGEFETGYAYLPLLGDLVQLGHRVGNHTLNHVLLSEVKPELADRELKDNQEDIDPFLTNELRLFRAPGGAWSARASRATDADPYLADLVGPIRWDVDRKDWENSLSCQSSRPATECEPRGRHGESRVRPDVVARRYLASIEAAGHGIVLFHDRVGDVGSSYALEVAEHVVPELERRGYVFAAPVLGFVETAERLAAPEDATLAGAASVRLQDLDGDGRADICLYAGGRRWCALSVELEGTVEDRRPHTVFQWLDRAFADESFRADDAAGTDALTGDLNGDGRPDLCERTASGVTCALSTGKGLTKATLWLSPEASREAARLLGSSALALGDVNGDGRADLCGFDGSSVLCALAP